MTRWMISCVPSVEPVSMMYHESMCAMDDRITASIDVASSLTILGWVSGGHTTTQHREQHREHRVEKKKSIGKIDRPRYEPSMCTFWYRQEKGG
jgi:hypothetical protein